MSMAFDQNDLQKVGIWLVRWARPVRPDMIRRLYKTDARGIIDEGPDR